MDSKLFQDTVALAERLADVARATSMKYFRTPLSIESKDDQSPVTLADREVEQQMRELITSTFPGHAICGEEFGSTQSAEYTWLLDPIDGTKPFVLGFPIFGSLICLMDQDRPTIGIIEIPATNERWIGTPDGAALNGRKVRTGSCRMLSDAKLAGTSPYDFSEEDCPKLHRLILQSAMHRFGGGCYSFGLLANGGVDLVIEAGLEPWDYMALVPVVEGAGGVITDWSGQQLGMLSDGRVVASCTPELHDEVLRSLRT
ncbi:MULTISPECIES: inositol monophosphatase family protein [unclassified Burkholderia]|uniref:inositol monophosphatase family protein n=1 Tax=unclassified Burkholderia TaxID=2613784 RepID=UPI000F55B59B|nr:MULTISPECIES: inositol monophosphatase family protein [unclassified Burkholderia]RQR68082.1 histidinol phosphate phosphatase [Burkholderia sp. Bp9012]RQR70285.1 histidinol phosphate phosphatase [Burkholderia sp. Bp9011]RQR83032.1 histidinol phosphate phosphatase [Burkholderia sp. Bp9010]RQZ38744.1 histidinol phosphate phosphatase [Burkholderia sp. Bp9099]